VSTSRDDSASFCFIYHTPFTRYNRLYNRFDSRLSCKQGFRKRLLCRITMSSTYWRSLIGGHLIQRRAGWAGRGRASAKKVSSQSIFIERARCFQHIHKIFNETVRTKTRYNSWTKFHRFIRVVNNWNKLPQKASWTNAFNKTLDRHCEGMGVYDRLQSSLMSTINFEQVARLKTATPPSSILTLDSKIHLRLSCTTDTLKNG